MCPGAFLQLGELRNALNKRRHVFLLLLALVLLFSCLHENVSRAENIANTAALAKAGGMRPDETRFGGMASAASEKSLASMAGQPVAAGSLRVITKPIAPFVIVDEQGRASGFSIELWEAVARRMGRDFTLQVVPDLKGLLDGVRNSEADVAIAAITITEQRERQMDFSHPFFRSGLQIMVRGGGNAGFLAQAGEVMRSLFDSRSFRLALWALVIIVLVAAHLVWLLERGRNEHFHRSYPRGLWDGTYWALVTISTVGYGDKVPRSEAGKVLASVLIVVGYIAYAWFTASIAASLTVSQLQGSINGPDDLRGRSVATVAHSTSARWLRHVPGARVREVKRIEQAYELLADGAVEAVVYDYPALRHQVLKDAQGRFRVVGPVFKGEDYGIALPQGSPLREALNRALLAVMESGEYDRIRQRWLGAEDGNRDAR